MCAASVVLSVVDLSRAMMAQRAVAVNKNWSVVVLLGEVQRPRVQSDDVGSA